MDGFFNENTTPTRTTPTEWDVGGARLLYNKLRDLSLCPKRPNIQEWANHFRLLREQNEIPKERIKKVLKYYLAHIKDEMMPQGYSGKGFRQRFYQIEAAMQRGTVGQIPPSLDAAARKLSKEMGLFWPTGTKPEDELYLIATSLMAYEEFRKNLKRQAANPKLKDWERFACRWLAERITHTTEFVEMWCRETHMLVHRAAANGRTPNLRNWRWRPDGRRYRARAEGLLANVVGEGAPTYARVLELIA